MKKQSINGIQIGIIIILALFSIYLVNQHPPEFFDNFGVVVFGFLLCLSIWMLRTKKEAPNWVAFIILLISILGLIVDGFIVFFS